eukprot:scaffold463464_cov20-Prasinocladus_malaysianus.AAC.1
MTCFIHVLRGNTSIAYGSLQVAAMPRRESKCRNMDAPPGLVGTTDTPQTLAILMYADFLVHTNDILAGRR